MNTDIEDFHTGEPVKTEIEELHKFFEDWFTGRVKRDISRFAGVMGEDFRLIPPSGQIFTKQQVVTSIQEGYDSQTDREIWVEEISTRLIGDLIIATYHELQTFNNETTKRISTAVFSFNPNLPNNCMWHLVHETWIIQGNDLT